MTDWWQGMFSVGPQQHGVTILTEEADPACHHTMSMGLSLSLLLLVRLLRAHTVNISSKLSRSEASLHLQFTLYFLHCQRPGSEQAGLS